MVRRVLDLAARAKSLAEADALDAALASAREATALAPTDADVANLLVTLLRYAHDEAELAREVERAAALQGIALDPLRAELAAAGMPTDPATLALNALPNGFRAIEARLRREADEARERETPGARAAELALLRDEAEAARAAVCVDVDRVPPDLRPYVPLARKWGVGDDGFRHVLLSAITADELRELRALRPAARRRIDAWVATFSPGAMPPEPEAFLYLLEAFDELPRRRARRRSPQPPNE